ncbi:MAG TPA: DUF4149 domain-containing protein [Burkholderiaceae bacterium]
MIGNSVWIDRTRRLIATFWIGSLWTIGYVVAPTLFATLSDRALAGTIAGSLFHVQAWMSLGCALAMLVLQMWQDRRSRNDLERDRRRGTHLIVGMVVCTVIGYFCLQPFMAALREAAGPAGVLASEAKLEFGVLHGTASFLYLVNSLLGLALILRLNSR